MATKALEGGAGRDQFSDILSSIAHSSLAGAVENWFQKQTKTKTFRV